MAAEATHDSTAAAATAATLAERRTSVLLSAVVIAAMTAGAWLGADRWYANDARQRAADHWAQLRRCLLGTGLALDERPGKRLARIALGTSRPASTDPAAWPQRCLPQATALDGQLARPALRRTLGALPSAATIVAANTPLAERTAALDALWRALRAADLPLPSAGALDERATPILRPPQPATPVLRLREMRPLAAAPASELVDLRIDSSRGRELRLLMGGPGSQRLLCSVHDDDAGVLFGAASCRTLRWAQPEVAFPKRLARGAAGAPTLVYASADRLADGFFDAASGQRIWRPRFADAQAFVRRTGEAAILYGVPTETAATARQGPPLVMGSAEIRTYRLVRLSPGRAPANRRLAVPPHARLLLLDTQLLWWFPAEAGDELRIGRLADGEAKLGAVRRLDMLPRGARLAGECRAERATALLFQAPRRDASPAPSQLVWLGDQGEARSVELGALPQPTELTCDDESASVSTRREAGTIRIWRCSSSSCEQSTTAAVPWVAQSAELLTSLPVGHRMLLVWTTPAAGLRLRIAEPLRLAQTPDSIVLGPTDVARLQPRSLKLVSARGAAVLLIRSARKGVYALRVAATGEVTPLPASR